jgi:hypothetical protein
VLTISISNEVNDMPDRNQNPDREHEEMVAEYERLLKCYQLASWDDRNVIWAVLNKYAPKIDEICD